MTALKTVRYRGGVLTFSIPASWCEEYEPEGGATFYEDRPDSSTLRLNVMTMEAPPNMRELSAMQALSDSEEGGDGRQIRALPDGNAVARYMQTPVEEGKQLHIHFWEVASPSPPRHMRLAVFSYTILASQASSDSIRQELELLDGLITKAQFAKELGISGEEPRKPMWKFW
jgi:hypothetical protein